MLVPGHFDYYHSKRLIVLSEGLLLSGTGYFWGS